MAQQKTKNILTRLISKVHSMLTQLNRNTTAIKVKAETNLSNVDKAAILAKLGITLTQATLTFDDNTTKQVFIVE